MPLPGRGHRRTPKPVIPDLNGIAGTVAPPVFNLLKSLVVSVQRLGAHLENTADATSVANVQTRMRLANGVNTNAAAFDPYESFIITGPTAAFSIGGFTKGAAGRFMVVVNETGQTLTILNEYAAATAVNRILTMTGADVIIPGNSSSIFSYDALAGRWVFGGAYTAVTVPLTANNITLANGLNDDISASTLYSSFVISGPTADFSLGGFTNGAAGREIIVFNNTTQAMTCVHESLTSTAANRLLSLTGADIVLGGLTAVRLLYDSNNSRWLIIGADDALGGFTTRGLNTKAFTASGGNSWTVPLGVTTVFFTGCAAGGGGAGTGSANGGGSGGGGDAIFRQDITVVPGTSYTVTVGAGGTAGAATDNGDGGTGGVSSFGGLFSLTGGGGGKAFNNGSAGGAAGGTLAQPGITGTATANSVAYGGISALFPVHVIVVSALAGVRGQGGNGVTTAAGVGGAGGDGYCILEW